MSRVRFIAVAWIADEPIPGLVECQIDATDGDSHRLIDKAPLFSSDLAQDSAYPVELELPCEVEAHDETGVSIRLPFGLEDQQGRSTIHVPAWSLID